MSIRFSRWRRSEAVRMPRDLLGQALVRLGRFQVAYPWVFVVAVLVSLFPTALGASRLELRTSFSEFLPRTSPSVLELERVRSRTAGTSTLTIAAEGDDPAALKRFVDSLVPRLETLGPRYVASVDAGPKDLIAFLRRYVWLFANLQDLRKLHARIQSKYDEVVARRAGYGLDLDDMTHPPSLSAELDEVERRLDGELRAIEETLPGDEGYYFTPDHGLIAIVVRTPFGSGDPRAFEMIDRIRGLAADALSEVAALGIRVRFTGNIVTSAEEHRTVTRDLTHVGAWGIGLVLAIVFLFFRRVRVLIIMAITIGVGCVWTFGLAELTVGYLNSASGFLISIIAGNGINFGILYMARYLEARRGGCDIQETILLCNEQTPRATLAAAAPAQMA
jgi:predicted RND superfamily exporter protein